MSNPFTLLGLPATFRLDPRELDQRHRDLARALHPDRLAHAAPAERRVAIERAAQVNEAHRALKNPLARAAALLATVGRAVEEHARAAPELLMEILEKREELEAARDAGSDRAARVGALRKDVVARVGAEEETIALAFDGAHPPEVAAVDRAYAALVKLKYLYRFLDEADAMLSED